MPKELHTIGGVVYAPITASTINHDVWLMGLIHESGLSEATVLEGESPESWSKRFMYELMASGKAVRILGGLLVPEDIGSDGWTPEVAGKTSEHLGSLTSEADKAAVFGILLTTLLSFFELGLISLWSTRKS